MSVELFAAMRVNVGDTATDGGVGGSQLFFMAGYGCGAALTVRWQTPNGRANVLLTRQSKADHVGLDASQAVAGYWMKVQSCSATTSSPHVSPHNPTMLLPLPAAPVDKQRKAMPSYYINHDTLLDCRWLYRFEMGPIRGTHGDHT